MRLAALLVLVIACSQPDQAPPSPAPTPSPTQTATPTPTPNPSPAPTPGATPTPPGGADCATDADCTTTTYGPEPVKATSGCCAALACTRVETAKRAEELAAAFSKLCSAVRCRAPDCPAGAPEPSPTCKAGRCASR